MASFISKSLFTATVTAPTFLSLGLIGIIKDSMNYFQLWGSMLKKHEIPTNFEWWSINFSLIFMLICFIGIKIFFYKLSPINTRRVKPLECNHIQIYLKIVLSR